MTFLSIVDDCDDLECGGLGCVVGIAADAGGESVVVADARVKVGRDLVGHHLIKFHVIGFFFSSAILDLPEDGVASGECVGRRAVSVERLRAGLDHKWSPHHAAVHWYSPDLYWAMSALIVPGTSYC